MTSKITMTIRLKSGAKAVLGISVVEDPAIPAPLEPEIVRQPYLTEFVEILHAMATCNFEGFDFDPD